MKHGLSSSVLGLLTPGWPTSAAFDGYGLVYAARSGQDHLDDGRLVRALSRFTLDLPGYHFY